MIRCDGKTFELKETTESIWLSLLGVSAPTIRHGTNTHIKLKFQPIFPVSHFSEMFELIMFVEVPITWQLNGSTIQDTLHL